MRPFNKNEKDIIKKLTEIDEIKLSTLSKFLQDCYFTEERGMSFRVLNKEKLEQWMKNGAQPTETVKALIKNA